MQAPHRRIDYDVVIDSEEICVVPLRLVVRIPVVRLLWRETLSRIFDEAHATLDPTGRKRTEPLDWRASDLERIHYISRNNDNCCTFHYSRKDE